MAGPNATTTACRRNSCSPRNTEGTVAKRSAFVRTSWLRPPHFLLTGHPTEWFDTTGKNFRLATATAYSLPFTVPGIGRLMRKAVTTWFFSHSTATTRRATARFLLTVLREQRRLRKALPIVLPGSRSGRAGHSTSLTTFTGEFIESSIRAIPPAQHPRALHARAFLLLLANSLLRPRSRQRVTPKIFRFQKGRRQIWLRLVFAFITV